MTTNVSVFTNMTGDPMIGIVRGVNTASNGVFGFMVLVAIFVITMSTAARFGMKTAFSTASFLTAIIAILLRYMGVISEKVLFGAIVMVVVAVLMLWFQRDA